VTHAAIDPDRFRALMGRFATGVTIVTTTRPDGRPIGMTANSLTSVSLEPPLLSVSVGQDATIKDALTQAGEFVVNILTTDQEHLSRRFAETAEDRFEGVEHRPGSNGHPVLRDSLASIECRLFGTFPAGDHTVFLGEVTGGETSRGRPLLYYRGGYTSLSDR